MRYGFKNLVGLYVFSKLHTYLQALNIPSQASQICSQSILHDSTEFGSTQIVQATEDEEDDDRAGDAGPSNAHETEVIFMDQIQYPGNKTQLYLLYK